MREDELFVLVLIAVIWIGWPLHGIARNFDRLVKLARKN